jgi:hypothetical protein
LYFRLSPNNLGSTLHARRRPMYCAITEVGRSYLKPGDVIERLAKRHPGLGPQGHLFLCSPAKAERSTAMRSPALKVRSRSAVSVSPQHVGANPSADLGSGRTADSRHKRLHPRPIPRKRIDLRVAHPRADPHRSTVCSRFHTPRRIEIRPASQIFRLQRRSLRQSQPRCACARLGATPTAQRLWAYPPGTCRGTASPPLSCPISS